MRLKEQAKIIEKVDSIREERKMLEEVSDPPLIRQQIALKLREYYAHNNIQVDERTINDGIDDYLNSRLRFEKVELTGASKVFAYIYTNRTAVLALIVIGCILAALMSLFGVNSIPLPFWGAR